MDYFWIKQDRRYVNALNMEGFYQKMRRKDFTLATADKIPDRNVMYCDAIEKQESPDILDQQVFLVSAPVKRVFQMYEKNITYKFFCLLNNITGDYFIYYAPIFPCVNCITSIKPDRSNITVNLHAINEMGIFRAECQDKDIIIVRLDVAESLMRRNLKGIDFKRIIISGGAS